MALGGVSSGEGGSVDAPSSSAVSSSSLTTPAGVLSFSGSASSELAWFGLRGIRAEEPARVV